MCACSPVIATPPRRVTIRTNGTECIPVSVIGWNIRKEVVPTNLPRLLSHASFLATKTRTCVSRPTPQYGSEPHNSRKCHGHDHLAAQHHHAVGAAVRLRNPVVDHDQVLDYVGALNRRAGSHPFCPCRILQPAWVEPLWPGKPPSLQSRRLSKGMGVSWHGYR